VRDPSTTTKIGEGDLADFVVLLSFFGLGDAIRSAASLMQTMLLNGRGRFVHSLRALAPRGKQQRKIRCIDESIAIDVCPTRWITPRCEKERQI